ncbi:MAG: P1 family peptidase [Anaerolineales bacterium]|nr:P1 family peptidase [Anaerolineales bacterium]MCB8953241.1 P1 family peptidase [Ardenticatenales bacterium]
MKEMIDGITAVAGIRVGHAQDEAALTGCTVVLCETGAVGGIDRRGGATSTRQADGLEPWHVVGGVHAVLLTGGSAFGLGASSGVMRYLDEKGIGYGVGAARVPIVAAAALFDLALGQGKAWPDAAMAYEACVRAGAEMPAQGSVGAGIGATVGKIHGLKQATKGGIGTAARRVGSTDLIVGALVAVNPFGDVVDPENGRIIAGARRKEPHPGSPFADSMQLLADWANRGYPRPPTPPLDSTVIGVVATNARLTKIEATKVAQMAQDGLARAVRPAHLMFDGDTIFTLATGEVETHVNVVGAVAAEVFAAAIVRGVQAAVSMGGLPAADDMA